MNVENARKWLLLSSLSATGLISIFFLAAPAAGFPLVFSQSLRVLEVVLPVFLGYVGSAASFVFRSGSAADQMVFRPGTSSLAEMLIKGPVVVFGLVLLAILLAFYSTNRPDAAPGSGMTVDELTGSVSVALGLLAVTTNLAVSYLFGG